VIASIQSALSDEELLQLRDDLARDVGRASLARRHHRRDRPRRHGITFAVRTLRAIAHMIRLRGAETVIVGIQPEVAFAMVQLGLTLEDITTALDLEEGLGA